MNPLDLLRTPTKLASAPLTVVARIGGAALGRTVRVVAAVRNVPKPLHPRGRSANATVTRFGGSESSGVPWLDSNGTSRAVVRHSGAIGFPLGWPDVQGIALRVDDGERQADLLFATTGLGRLARYTLTASTCIEGRPYTTLLPYRGPTGAVLLALEPQSSTRMTLLWAHGSGKWCAFGTLELTDSYDGPALSFDPMLKTLPGLLPYPWVRALRAPAYRVARHHRGERLPRPTDVADGRPSSSPESDVPARAGLGT